MKNWQKHSVCVVCGLAVGALAMWLCQRCSHEPIEPIVIHDTICRTDTAYLAGKTKTLYVVRHDTIREWEYDTITHTEYAVVPIEQRLYKDTFATDTSSIALAVAFSGYKAQIDSVGLDYTFVVQPRTIREKKGFGWCVMPSVQVGYGVAFGNQVVATPYVGVGVSVGFGYTW